MPAAIWVVDDEPYIRAAVLAALEEADYACEGFENAEALYRRLLDAEEPPALIIVDEMLPDESGDMIVRSLRERPQYRDIEFLFLTAVSADDAGRLSDLAPVLRKPFDFRDLIEIVERTVPRDADEQPAAGG